VRAVPLHGAKPWAFGSTIRGVLSYLDASGDVSGFRVLIFVRLATEICEQHKCRRKDKPRCCSSKLDVVLSSGRRAPLGRSCFPRILTLYWLRVRCVQAGWVNTPESNWLNLGFGVSRRSVKNKMFCAHVTSHESGVTTVSRKAVGRHTQRSIKNSCVCWHLCRHTARFVVTRCTTTSQKLRTAAMTKLLRGRALSS
jgi:hypothetical protein